MKKCSKCNEVKTSNEFYVKNEKTGLLQSCCIQCHKVVSRKHYEENKALVKARSKVSRAKIKRQYENYIIEYLLTHPCECGEKDIRLLEFHHLADKVSEVSLLCNNKFSSVIEEISKCKVLCVSCHRKVTHAEQNSFKHKYYLAIV